MMRLPPPHLPAPRRHRPWSRDPQVRSQASSWSVRDSSARGGAEGEALAAAVRRCSVTDTLRLSTPFAFTHICPPSTVLPPDSRCRRIC